MDGSWSEWSPWNATCSSCGSGVKTRYRFCTNPSPLHGGSNCSGQSQETEDCNLPPCPGNYYHNFIIICRVFFNRRWCFPVFKKELLLRLKGILELNMPLNSFSRIFWFQMPKTKWWPKSLRFIAVPYQFEHLRTFYFNSVESNLKSHSHECVHYYYCCEYLLRDVHVYA